jgi:hypothetical protein
MRAKHFLLCSIQISYYISGDTRINYSRYKLLTQRANIFLAIMNLVNLEWDSWG